MVNFHSINLSHLIDIAKFVSTAGDATIELKIAASKHKELRKLIKNCKKYEIYKDDHNFDYSLLKKYAKKLGKHQYAVNKRKNTHNIVEFIVESLTILLTAQT